MTSHDCPTCRCDDWEPPRLTGPGSTDEHRAQALQAARDAVQAARERRKVER